MFSEWMKNPSVNSIDRNLRQIVYATAVQHGGEEEHEFVLKQFKDEINGLEKGRMKVAVLASGIEGLIQKFRNESGVKETPDVSKTSKEIEEADKNNEWWMKNKMKIVTDWMREASSY